MAARRNAQVAYFYDEEIGNYHYGPGHPMKPHRIRMAHALVNNYGLYNNLEIFRPYQLTTGEMTMFHADDYIQFLTQVKPSNQGSFARELTRYNCDVDCPIFDGLFRFCQLSSGGSVGGAYRLNHGTADIAINWAGGLHHAKKAEASGFCYVNDIVLAILELLKYHARVLYIDIDIHHGDGVEEAFYTTDRVMTLSFHKFGEYFPGTGHVRDTGVGAGKSYALNFPLHDGVDDDSYIRVFEPVVTRVVEYYQPGAIVLQCGADSLSGDRLGCFNLTLDAHSRCVEFCKALNIPLLVLGGGGYSIANVARAWCLETAVCVSQQDKISRDIPSNEFYEYYAPLFKLEVRASNQENLNSPVYMDKIKTQLLQVLRELPHAPSVQYHQADRDLYVPPEWDEDLFKDERLPEHEKDRLIVLENEFYDSVTDMDRDAPETDAAAADAAAAAAVDPTAAALVQAASADAGLAAPLKQERADEATAAVAAPANPASDSAAAAAAPSAGGAPGVAATAQEALASLPVLSSASVGLPGPGDAAPAAGTSALPGP